MFFLVVFNGTNKVFSCWNNERFMREGDEHIIISCHDTQEEAFNKSEQYNKILNDEGQAK